MKTRISMTIEPELLAKMDRMRGKKKRSAFIVQAIELITSYDGPGVKHLTNEEALELAKELRATEKELMDR
jgi:metal-responsive CopG/Arc/MetJ family transcriptional regulator